MDPHNLIPFFLLITFLITAASAQPSSSDTAAAGPTSPASLKPSVAVVMGIFSIMFSFTFLLLMYAKFCHSAAYDLFNRDPNRRPGGSFAINPTNHSNGRTASGIDKSVIESLPFFRFSSLKGSRDGLECAVCLSKFDDTELLRLLPKCKHAFHIHCVDRWLESHSTCPLCRCRIDPCNDDDTLFKNSPSRLLLRDTLQLHHSDSSRRVVDSEIEIEELEIELFVKREPEENHFGLSSRSLRFGSSRSKKDEMLIEKDKNHSNELFLHKFKHRIIVSDVVFKSRWSDFNSSDLMSLNSDMLNVVSSQRFITTEVGPELKKSPVVDNSVVMIKEEMKRKRRLESKASEISNRPSTTSTPTRSLLSPRNRCMSEITNVPRFQGAKNAGSSVADEKVRRLWLPMARRTVQWFAGREKRQEFQRNTEDSNV